jgi:hypothetical protein
MQGFKEERKMLVNRTLAIAMMAVLALPLGCRIESNKQGNSDNVKIATPFGGMSVKTNDAAVLQGTGLPPYPGAELVKNDKDNGAADVNLSFGSFQLRVKAVSYRTSDAPEQVASFYRKALGRYGDVIECSNSKPVGTPTRTTEGLGCESDKGDKNFNMNDEMNGKTELKAGSKLHQHIVAINPEGAGTKFGLVALDLPSHVTMGDDTGGSKQ